MQPRKSILDDLCIFIKLLQLTYLDELTKIDPETPSNGTPCIQLPSRQTDCSRVPPAARTVAGCRHRFQGLAPREEAKPRLLARSFGWISALRAREGAGVFSRRRRKFPPSHRINQVNFEFFFSFKSSSHCTFLIIVDLRDFLLAKYFCHIPVKNNLCSKLQTEATHIEIYRWQHGDRTA